MGRAYVCVCAQHILQKYGYTTIQGLLTQNWHLVLTYTCKALGEPSHRLVPWWKTSKKIWVASKHYRYPLLGLIQGLPFHIHNFLLLALRGLTQEGKGTIVGTISSKSPSSRRWRYHCRCWFTLTPHVSTYNEQCERFWEQILKIELWM